MNAEIKELYDNLVADCMRRDAREKLAVLKSVLDDQVDNNVTVFSLKYVAKLSEERGGPAYQTIINIKGKRYKTLFEKYVEVYEKKREKPLTVNEDSWIYKIEDTASQYRIKRMQSELKKLKSENDLLRQVKSELVIKLDNFDGGIEAIENQTKQIKALPINLLTSELETLSKLLNEAYLQRNNLHYNEKGALVYTYESGKNVQITDRLMDSALNKVLSVHDSDVK
tara:strand:- start:166 stop:843 length:678 start_codon:yes stop_codon:yes gene_type:complete